MMTSACLRRFISTTRGQVCVCVHVCALVCVYVCNVVVVTSTCLKRCDSDLQGQVCVDVVCWCGLN